MELYFDLSDDEEETELIKTVLQDITHHERMSHPNFKNLPNDDGDEEEEEEALKPTKSQQDIAIDKSKTPLQEVIPEEASVHFKPHRLSFQTSNKEQKKISLSEKGTQSSYRSKTKPGIPVVAEENVVVEASLRKAGQLEEMQKESLLRRMAGAGENTKAILMNGINVFDFGSVPMGQRKYIMVNVANIGVDRVRLKMSILNPYGPFSFCNSLKEIPQDTYFSLKFKYQPTGTDIESQETVKIEEIGKPENFIIIKLRGYAVGWQGEE